MKLKYEDFANPMFNGKLVKRQDRLTKEWFIDGLTYTDNFRQVGFTYYLKSGLLTIACFTKSGNYPLFKRHIDSIDDFEAAIKKADKKITKKRLQVITLKE